jgi:hypothetical protein
VQSVATASFTSRKQPSGTEPPQVIFIDARAVHRQIARQRETRKSKAEDIRQEKQAARPSTQRRRERQAICCAMRSAVARTACKVGERTRQ